MKICLYDTSHRHMGRYFGILIAWIAANNLLMPLCIMFFASRMKAKMLKADREKNNWRPQILYRPHTVYLVHYFIINLLIAYQHCLWTACHWSLYFRSWRHEPSHSVELKQSTHPCKMPSMSPRFVMCSPVAVLAGCLSFHYLQQSAQIATHLAIAKYEQYSCVSPLYEPYCGMQAGESRQTSCHCLAVLVYVRYFVASVSSPAKAWLHLCYFVCWLCFQQSLCGRDTPCVCQRSRTKEPLVSEIRMVFITKLVFTMQLFVISLIIVIWCEKMQFLNTGGSANGIRKHLPYLLSHITCFHHRPLWFTQNV